MWFPCSWGCPTSVRDLAHYSQEVRSGDWQMYDFGSKSANNDHYGQETPPLFPLGSLAVDTALFSAKFDTLAGMADSAPLHPVVGVPVVCDPCLIFVLPSMQIQQMCHA